MFREYIVKAVGEGTRRFVKEVLVGLDKIIIKHSIPITGATGSNSSSEKKSYQLRSRSNVTIFWKSMVFNVDFPGRH
jgi:hypothetical protein